MVLIHANETAGHLFIHCNSAHRRGQDITFGGGRLIEPRSWQVWERDPI